MFVETKFVAATKHGTAAGEVLHWFHSRAKRAKLVIGHDLHQDLANLAAASALLKQEWDQPRRIFSTMYGSIAAGFASPTVAPKRIDLNGNLQPTLAECLEKATGEPLEGALGIRSEVQAIWKVFRHLRMHINQTEL
jgi:hypothetical protein